MTAPRTLLAVQALTAAVALTTVVIACRHRIWYAAGTGGVIGAVCVAWVLARHAGAPAWIGFPAAAIELGATAGYARHVRHQHRAQRAQRPQRR